MPSLPNNEEKLHRSMMLRDALEGAGKGGALGALAGSAARASGAARGAGFGAAVGSAVGGAVGAAKSRERVLKDIVKEQRMDDRFERRLERRKHAAFREELEKTAFMTQLAQTIGKGALQLGKRGATAVGQGAAYKGLVQKGMQSAIGGKNFARNVGYGVMGAGAALGTGYALGS